VATEQQRGGADTVRSRQAASEKCTVAMLRLNRELTGNFAQRLVFRRRTQVMPPIMTGPSRMSVEGSGTTVMLYVNEAPGPRTFGPTSTLIVCSPTGSISKIVVIPTPKIAATALSPGPRGIGLA
jgi:hypothetical protein